MDRIPLNDLGRVPAARTDAREAALLRVVRSGWYLRGPETSAFESELASLLDVPAAVAVGNGTDALELALRGLGCAPGGTVVTAANAGGYATTAMLRAGLRPLWADVDPGTHGLSESSVRHALDRADEPPQAVVVTHLYGRLADVEPIVALCQERDIAVLEDCAQAIGAQRGGVRAGAFGDAASFSFYPTKNLGALGDAGAVASRSSEVVDRVRVLAQYGWSEKYTVGVEGGGNSRIDELQAAVLREGLTRIDGDNARRREILQRYADALPARVGRIAGGPAIGEEHVAHLAVGQVEDRHAVAVALADRGIDTAVHYPVPDHLQPAWRHLADDVHLPVTETAADHVLSLPLFPELTDGEVARVCEALDSL